MIPAGTTEATFMHGKFVLAEGGRIDHDPIFDIKESHIKEHCFRNHDLKPCSRTLSHPAKNLEMLCPRFTSKRWSYFDRAEDWIYTKKSIKLNTQRSNSTKYAIAIFKCILFIEGVRDYSITMASSCNRNAKWPVARLFINPRKPTVSNRLHSLISEPLFEETNFRSKKSCFKLKLNPQYRKTHKAQQMNSPVQSPKFFTITAK